MLLTVLGRVDICACASVTYHDGLMDVNYLVLAVLLVHIVHACAVCAVR